MCNATDDPARERRHIEQLLGKRVDGLVVTARRADQREPIEPARARTAGGLCVLARRGSRRILPAARRRGRRQARGRAPRRPRTQTHRRTSPGPSGSRRCACARKAIGRRWPRLAWRRGPRLPGRWSEAWGREAVADHLLAARAPRPTRCFAATTRSRAARSTRCARWAAPCRRTSRWSASTIGT